MWNHGLENFGLVSLDFAKAELLEERRQWILDYCQDRESQQGSLGHSWGGFAGCEDPDNGKEFPEKCLP